MSSVHQESGSASRLRILLCDDDPGMLLMLRTLFVKNGYTICGEAQTGVETAVQVAEKRPDIVLLDIGMPQGSGLTVLPLLREIDEDARIIMLTVDNASESVHTAMSLGAKGYILKKDLDPIRLLAAVRRAAACHTLTEESTPTLKKEAQVERDKQTIEVTEEGTYAAKEQTQVERDIQTIKVVVDELPGVGKIYVTGGLHVSETGSVFMYHPLTATRERGEVKRTVREILQHPSFFTSLFKKMESFKEIPSILYDQGFCGGIFELLLKPMPSRSATESLAFAVRHHEAAEDLECPLGLAYDGGPYTIHDANPPEPYESLPNEHLLNDDLQSSELRNYICSFNGLSLEACLFLSAFNILEIIGETRDSRLTNEKVLSHIRQVRSYAKWQEIPKAIIFGHFSLLPLPGEPKTKLVVTVSLSEIESDSEDQTDMYYWMDVRRHHAHLQHYLNRWSQRVMPLLQLEGFGTLSLLFDRGQKHRYGIKKSMNPTDVFNERGYTFSSLKNLTSEFPSLRLCDLMRPLLLNTLLARFPSMRVETSLESSLDVHCRRQHAKEMMAGDGLRSIEKAVPFLYKGACEELQTLGLNESNPDYVKELIRQITVRYAASGNLSTKTKPIEPLDEDEAARRRRVKDLQILDRRYKEKYGES